MQNKEPTLTLSEKKEVEKVKSKNSHSEGLKHEQQILETKREEYNNRFKNL